MIPRELAERYETAIRRLAAAIEAHEVAERKARGFELHQARLELEAALQDVETLTAAVDAAAAA